jgi:hypothetical protein
MFWKRSEAAVVTSNINIAKNMNITCINPNCKNQIVISGLWVSSATCFNCGTVHYPPFIQSGAVPPPVSSVDNAPKFVSLSDEYMSPPSMPNLVPEQGRNLMEQSVKNEVQSIAILVAEDNFGQKQEYRLKLGVNIIGRATANTQVDVVLTDASISRPHCVVEVLENKPHGWKYMLYDIGYTNRKESTNGLYLPFRSTRLSKYEQVELQIGSYVIAGNIKLELR